MSTLLEMRFFRVFGIQAQTKIHEIRDGLVECNYVYPRITDKKMIELENIFAHSDMNGSGFYDGFHVHQHQFGRKLFWEYTLTYRKGGYYASGVGETRKEALICQLLKIMKDGEVDVDEKEIIKREVLNIFKEK